MATGNSSGGDKGYEDLCNTLCPEAVGGDGAADVSGR